MQTTPDGLGQQSVDIGFALRIKSLAPTQRKAFFAHLKGAQQVHFANTIAEPGKSKVTSIHPPEQVAFSPDTRSLYIGTRLPGCSDACEN
jgi:hypothetical protein